MAILSSLSRSQKETVGLLQVGTFLEYFGLMLYIHIAVLLKDLFFPKTDPKTASLLTAFAFCSTYLLRPFGAHFPVFKRFTYVSFIYAVSRSLMAVVTSFGLVYLTDFLGVWGLYLILLPVTLSFLWGVTQYEKLENLTQKPFLRSLFDWKSMPSQSFEPIFDRSLNYQKAAEK